MHRCSSPFRPLLDTDVSSLKWEHANAISLLNFFFRGLPPHTVIVEHFANDWTFLLASEHRTQVYDQISILFSQFTEIALALRLGLRIRSGFGFRVRFGFRVWFEGKGSFSVKTRLKKKTFLCPPKKNLSNLTHITVSRRKQTNSTHLRNSSGVYFIGIYLGLWEANFSTAHISLNVKCFLIPSATYRKRGGSSDLHRCSSNFLANSVDREMICSSYSSITRLGSTTPKSAVKGQGGKSLLKASAKKSNTWPQNEVVWQRTLLSIYCMYWGTKRRSVEPWCALSPSRSEEEQPLGNSRRTLSRECSAGETASRSSQFWGSLLHGWNDASFHPYRVRHSNRARFFPQEELDSNHQSSSPGINPWL